MAAVARAGLALGVLGGLVVGLTGCGRAPSGQLRWAQAALERNPGVEVVSTDPAKDTLTIRLRDSGTLEVVSADRIVGFLPARQRGSASAGKPELVHVVNASPGQAPPPSGPAAVDVPAAANGGPDDGQQNASPAAGGTGASAAEAFAHDAAPLGAAPSPTPSLAPGERVLAAGPGYSIVETSKPAPGNGSSSSGHTRVTDAPLETHHEPIICQGERLLSIDNRNLAFDGNAITAEDGCEIHITNSRISAAGVGILARDASVHIENSEIEGQAGSIDAAEGAQIYAEASTFKGVRRRLDHASIHDLGNNVWD